MLGMYMYMYVCTWLDFLWPLGLYDSYVTLQMQLMGDDAISTVHVV